MLSGLDETRTLAAGAHVVVAEEKILEAFADTQVQIIAIRAELALPIVLRELRAGAGDVALVDANYVRGERDIYGKSSAVVAGETI